MTLPHSFSEVVDLWPSAVALADDIGEKHTTVRAWRVRNSIPGEKWLTVIAAAESRGIDGVTLGLLAALASVRAVTPATRVTPAHPPATP